MSAPEPTPRERAAALRAGVAALAEAQEALRRAEGFFGAGQMVPVGGMPASAHTAGMHDLAADLAHRAREWAQRLEAHDD